MVITALVSFISFIAYIHSLFYHCDLLGTYSNPEYGFDLTNLQAVPVYYYLAYSIYVILIIFSLSFLYRKCCRKDDENEDDIKDSIRTDESFLNLVIKDGENSLMKTLKSNERSTLVRKTLKAYE